MAEPTASRPYMPGYGLVDAGQGSGLLPWSWAVDRLQRSHDYWLATSRPDGRPHVMPVWGVWMHDALWFSSSRGSRKTRNLLARPQCAITTDNAYEPVVIDGEAGVDGVPGAHTGVVAVAHLEDQEQYAADVLSPADHTRFSAPP